VGNSHKSERFQKMIAFLQRVSQANVSVDSQVVAEIGRGLMVLLCAERDDSEIQAAWLLNKIINYRIFADDEGKMNRSLLHLAEILPWQEVGLLLVPQFTLAADTRSGTRPSFTPAAPPELARELFEQFVNAAQALKIPGLKVAAGVFGADMQVALINDGPVSFWLQTRKNATSSASPALN
jgi:D-aminoacyl-tRNA deacylase